MLILDEFISVVKNNFSWYARILRRYVTESGFKKILNRTFDFHLFNFCTFSISFCKNLFFFNVVISENKEMCILNLEKEKDKYESHN